MSVVAHRKYLEEWLFQSCLPLWWNVGGLKERGGFAETIELDGTASQVPLRSRVNPRMVYVFCEAGRLGWQGPWQEAALHGYQHYHDAFQLENGSFGALIDVEGKLVDETFDLYNQAFALLSYASVADTMPEHKDEALAKARALFAFIKANYAHPEIGFQSTMPPSAPLCANPHMHMFEASQALEAIDPEGPWAELADMLAKVCLEKLLDSESGVLREFFALDWQPAEGELGREVEPGHLFEWAWLLLRWAGKRDQNKAAIAAAKRLFTIAYEHGVDFDRNATVMGIDVDFNMRDPLARLWGQTEWVKASLSLLLHAESAEEAELYQKSLAQGLDALKHFIADAPAGLWRDKLTPEGTFVEEAAPASTLYHIICAIAELRNFSEQQEGLELLL
ncbi:AGE family epimerase/isomerase [Polycladidibacter stylochi]|uniref:AGE family epimerase/isomerase n=1 Tax=Polycladidibacter stylochi TaxID=1807766 RepID=UPI000830E684|nr:AGE family epimerase/isomerase [Pseudovibrio stylochi]